MEKLTVTQKQNLMTNTGVLVGSFGGMLIAKKMNKCLFCHAMLMTIGAVVLGIASNEAGKKIFKA